MNDASLLHQDGHPGGRATASTFKNQSNKRGGRGPGPETIPPRIVPMVRYAQVSLRRTRSTRTGSGSTFRKPENPLRPLMSHALSHGEWTSDDTAFVTEDEMQEFGLPELPDYDRIVKDLQDEVAETRTLIQHTKEGIQVRDFI